MSPKNQYISHFYPFEISLADKNIKKQKKKTIQLNLSVFVKEKLKHIVNDTSKKNVSTSEAIFNIFLNKELLLVDIDTFKKYKDLFIKQFEYFISRNEPILFNVTQFAYKIPNPLKTRSTLPDLGELAFLSQLNDITLLIKRLYNPGAQIIIYGESYIFYKIVGISKSEASHYYKTIQSWIKTLNWQNNLKLYDLSKLQKKVPNFNKEISKNRKNILDGLKTKDKDIIATITQVEKTLYTSLNTRKYPYFKLMDIYNEEMTSPTLKKIRNMLYKQARKQSIPYTAYHQTINTSGLSSLLFPHSIKLSFTNGEKKISLFPIGKDAKLYCYHGVPILRNDGSVIIRYEVDIIRQTQYIQYFLKGSKYPFYYSSNQ